MSDTLIEKVYKQIFPEPFDSSVFGAGLAQETRWVPLVNGGTTLGSHRLRRASLNRLQFVTTGRARLWFASVAGFGCFIIGLPWILSAVGEPVPWAAIPLCFLFGLCWVGLALYLWSRFGVFYNLDRRLGVSWKGNGPPPDGEPKGSEGVVLLERVRALQILRECIENEGYALYSYELNMVLDDASRVNVVDHGDIGRIRREAVTLAEFLGGVPVWDASREG